VPQLTARNESMNLQFVAMAIQIYLIAEVDSCRKLSSIHEQSRKYLGIWFL